MKVVEVYKKRLRYCDLVGLFFISGDNVGKFIILVLYRVNVFVFSPEQLHPDVS